MNDFRYDSPRDEWTGRSAEGIRWFRIYSAWTDTFPTKTSTTPNNQWAMAKQAVWHSSRQEWISTEIQEKLWEPQRVWKPRLNTLVRATFNPENSRWELLPPPSGIRMAITIPDATKTPTYPVQGLEFVVSAEVYNTGNVFPIAFVDPGYLEQAGRQDGHFSYPTTPEAFVFVLSRNWAPPLTKLGVWYDKGSDPAFPGAWWTGWKDEIRHGLTTSDIQYNSAGYVKEYVPAFPIPQDIPITPTRNWLCRIWPFGDVAGVRNGTRVFIHQQQDVAYITNASCDPFPSGSGG